MALLAIAAAIGKRVLPKVGKAIARAVGGARRVASSPAARTALTLATGATAIPPILRSAVPGGPPRLPPGFAPQGTQGGAPVPREGVVGRTISRILPGGMTGREFTPYEGAERDRLGRPIAVYPETVERLNAPTGYVIVRLPDGSPIAMLKGAARAMGLWKGRPKPPVSGWDMRAIARAKSARGRVKKLAGAVGLATKSKGR